MSNYGKIQFVDYYCEAPQNARFILRSLSDDSWVLQEYQQNTQRDLAYFPSSSCYKENFVKILETCRKIVKSARVIWVERPLWELDNIISDNDE